MNHRSSWRRSAGAAVVYLVCGGYLANAGPRPVAESSPLAAALSQVGQTRSVRDGVYSGAQAMRGRQQYEYFCGSCHLQSLEGDPGRDVPALNDERFQTEWNGRTAQALFEQISKTMPQNTPGSLSASNYVDVIAYLLQANDAPAGSQELSPTPEALERVRLDLSRPGVGK